MYSRIVKWFFHSRPGKACKLVLVRVNACLGLDHVCGVVDDDVKNRSHPLTFCVGNQLLKSSFDPK